MAKKDYAKLEEKVIRIFNNEGSFFYNGTRYQVQAAGKPYPSSGECKTDVYILGRTLDSEIELKISVKTKSSNEFQQNKMTPDVAEADFGIGWKEIIKNTALSINTRFEERPLIFVKGKHPVKPDSITLGWKLEIADKPRDLSAKIQLTEQEIRDFVYKGLALADDKRNAVVNGQIINNSGVADYLLKTELDEINTTNDVLQRIQNINEIELRPTYLIFTANNYRTKEDKCDGPRSLAVRVLWSCERGKLAHRIVYDEPLIYTGQNDVKPLLTKALRDLGKAHPSDLDIDNDILDPSIVLP